MGLLSQLETRSFGSPDITLQASLSAELFGLWHVGDALSLSIMPTACTAAPLRQNVIGGNG
jgi:hypothetical protein